MKKLLEELQQRKVLRTLGAYGIVAWGVLQGADIAGQVLRLPEWTITALVILFAVGVPIVALLAWVFQITPEGIRRDAVVERVSSESTGIGRSVDFIVIALLLVVLAYFVFADREQTAATSVNAIGPSIAVLPFDNFSGDPTKDYISDGLSEELLNLLANVPGLKVPGRTSSFYFRGRQADPREIGRQLGVATILEGSVRQSGERIRVTAQLIDAADGFHLWSQNYDYELDDLLNLQDRIAGEVVHALKGKLLGSEEVAFVTDRGTDSPAAHTAYLRGRLALHQRREESIVQAESLFRRAAEIDPGYARAWAGIAESVILQSSNHKLLPMPEAVAKAQSAMDKALALPHKSAEIYAALGLVQSEAMDMEGAEAAYRQAIALNPNYAEAWHWYGLLEGKRGDLSASMEKLERALEYDPLHPAIRSNVGRMYLRLGRFDAAREHFESGVQIDPDVPFNYGWLSALALTRPFARPDEALDWLAKAPAGGTQESAMVAWMQTLGRLELGQVEQARAQAEALLSENGPQRNTVEPLLAVLLHGGDEAELVATTQRLLADGGEELGPAADLLRALQAFAAGKPAQAAAAFEAYDHGFAATPEPKIHTENLRYAVLYALACREAGRIDRFEQLLAAIEQQIADRTRFGPEGFGLVDVEIAALRGDTDMALQRLETAWSSGLRQRLVHSIWTLEGYPAFRSLRAEPRFLTVANALDDYVAGIRLEMAPL